MTFKTISKTKIISKTETKKLVSAHSSDGKATDIFNGKTQTVGGSKLGIVKSTWTARSMVQMNNHWEN